MASYVWDAVLNLAEAGTAAAAPQRAQRVLLSGVVAAMQVTGRLDLAVPAAWHEHFFPPHQADRLNPDVSAPGLLSGHFDQRTSRDDIQVPSITSLSEARGSSERGVRRGHVFHDDVPDVALAHQDPAYRRRALFIGRSGPGRSWSSGGRPHQLGRRDRSDSGAHNCQLWEGAVVMRDDLFSEAARRTVASTQYSVCAPVITR